MNIIRKYKLHKIFKNSLTKKEIRDLNIILKYLKYSKDNEEQINFLYSHFFNLEKVKFKDYPNFIYFKEGKFIFEISNEFIIVNNELIWLVFENKFKYDNYYSISYLLNNIIEKAYKLNNMEVNRRFGRQDNELEILYKIFKK